MAAAACAARERATHVEALGAQALLVGLDEVLALVLAVERDALRCVRACQRQVAGAASSPPLLRASCAPSAGARVRVSARARARVRAAASAPRRAGASSPDTRSKSSSSAWRRLPAPPPPPPRPPTCPQHTRGVAAPRARLHNPSGAVPIFGSYSPSSSHIGGGKWNVLDVSVCV